MTKENHLTEKDLAKRWGFAPRTIQRWRWSKIGPAYIKICGRIRYTVKAIEDFESKNLYPSGMNQFHSSSREVAYA